MSNKITLFAHSKETKHPETWELDDFLDAIKTGKWQDKIINLWNEKDPEKYNILKESLPNATMSGTFSKRNNSSLLEHSGYIAIDIDKLGEHVHTIKTTLSDDPYFYTLFTSCSGKGLCGLVKIEPDKHKQSHKQISNYLAAKYGVHVKVDKQCSDLSRIRFVSYDPDLYYNPQSKLFKAKKQAPGPKTEKKDYLIVPADFDKIVTEITDRKIDITAEYDNWRNLGFSIATSFDEDGREFFHRLSEMHEDYDPDECDKKYDNFLQTKSGTLDISWFYDYIKKNYNIKAYSQTTEAILRASQAAYEFGIADGTEGVKELLRTKHNFTEQQIDESEELIAQAIKKRIPIGGDSLIADVEAFLYQRFDIKKNLLIQTVEIDNKKIDQTKLNTLYVDTAKLFPKVTMQMIRSVINTEFTPSYHPVTMLIDKYLLNPPAQPTGHIQKMISTIKTDTPNAAYFIKKWMVAMLPSAYGEHSVLLLVLCGVLNSGKTEWFRRYLPPTLKQYRADSSLEHGNDSDVLMSKKLLILDDEMGGKSKTEEKLLKNRTSKQEMDIRKPYDAEETTLNRIAMLAGTSNDPALLNDQFGNRRLICVNVLDVDKELYNSIDKELLLFECYLEWKAGFDHRLTNADIKLLKESSTEFVATNFTDEMFDKYFAHPEQSTYEITPMTTTEIQIYLSFKTQGAGRIDGKRVSQILNTQGFKNNRTSKRRLWQIVQLTNDTQDEIL